MEGIGRRDTEVSVGAAGEVSFGFDPNMTSSTGNLSYTTGNGANQQHPPSNGNALPQPAGMNTFMGFESANPQPSTSSFVHGSGARPHTAPEEQQFGATMSGFQPAKVSGEGILEEEDMLESSVRRSSRKRKADDSSSPRSPPPAKRGGAPARGGRGGRTRGRGGRGGGKVGAGSGSASGNGSVPSPSNSPGPSPGEDEEAEFTGFADPETFDGGQFEEMAGGKQKHKPLNIRYIEDKQKRHITFSKRKAGIMKKAYELSVLTGTQLLLLVVSETGLVYTYTTTKLAPLVSEPQGKGLIQSCLTTPGGRQAVFQPDPTIRPHPQPYPPYPMVGPYGSPYPGPPPPHHRPYPPPPGHMRGPPGPPPGPPPPQNGPMGMPMAGGPGPSHVRPRPSPHRSDPGLQASNPSGPFPPPTFQPHPQAPQPGSRSRMNTAPQQSRDGSTAGFPEPSWTPGSRRSSYPGFGPAEYPPSSSGASSGPPPRPYPPPEMSNGPSQHGTPSRPPEAGTYGDRGDNTYSYSAPYGQPQRRSSTYMESRPGGQPPVPLHTLSQPNSSTQPQFPYNPNSSGDSNGTDPNTGFSRGPPQAPYSLGTTMPQSEDQSSSGGPPSTLYNQNMNSIGTHSQSYQHSSQTGSLPPGSNNMSYYVQSRSDPRYVAPSDMTMGTDDPSGNPELNASYTPHRSFDAGPQGPSQSNLAVGVPVAGPSIAVAQEELPNDPPGPS